MRSSSGSPNIRVVARDFHHEPEVCTNHFGPGLLIAAFDPVSQLDFLLRGQQRNLSNLPKVKLKSRLVVFRGHADHTIETFENL